MNIVPQPRHALVNAALGHHRVWYVDGLESGPMLAISPTIGALDLEGSPDAGKDHLHFVDGARWRWPAVREVHVVDDEVRFEPIHWPLREDAPGATMRPLTLAEGKRLGLPEAEDAPDEATFDARFPR